MYFKSILTNFNEVENYSYMENKKHLNYYWVLYRINYY